jgi:hypothetical protein
MLAFLLFVCYKWVGFDGEFLCQTVLTTTGVKSMVKTTKLVGALLAAALLSTAAYASPLLGTINHDYGSAGTSQVAPTQVGSAGTLNANSVTVSSNKNASRFYDQFDFSAEGITGTIDTIKLTMGFTGARDQSFIPFLGSFERWEPRPASSTSNGSFDSQDYLAANGTQTWSFDSTLDVFDDIVAANSFYLWMSREGGWGVNTVNLDFARVDVYGTKPPVVTDVPEPGSLALMGLGMIGLAGFTRRRKDQEVL